MDCNGPWSFWGLQDRLGFTFHPISWPSTAQSCRVQSFRFGQGRGNGYCNSSGEALGLSFPPGAYRSRAIPATTYFLSAPMRLAPTIWLRETSATFPDFGKGQR